MLVRLGDEGWVRSGLGHAFSRAWIHHGHQYTAITFRLSFPLLLFFRVSFCGVFLRVFRMAMGVSRNYRFAPVVSSPLQGSSVFLPSLFRSSSLNIASVYAIFHPQSSSSPFIHRPLVTILTPPSRSPSLSPFNMHAFPPQVTSRLLYDRYASSLISLIPSRPPKGLASCTLSLPTVVDRSAFRPQPFISDITL